MKVKATKLGYYGLERRYEGDVFEISDEKDETGKVKAFSSKWMENVDSHTPVKSEKPAKQGQHILQEVAKPISKPATEESKEGSTEGEVASIPTGDSEVI